MEHVDYDVLGGIVTAALAIVYVVRQEGRLNLLTEIMKRVEKRLEDIERRYNLDGQYTTIHRRPYHTNPAE